MAALVSTGNLFILLLPKKRDTLVFMAYSMLFNSYHFLFYNKYMDVGVYILVVFNKYYGKEEAALFLTCSH